MELLDPTPAMSCAQPDPHPYKQYWNQVMRVANNPMHNHIRKQAKTRETSLLSS